MASDIFSEPPRHAYSNNPILIFGRILGPGHLWGLRVSLGSILGVLSIETFGGGWGGSSQGALLTPPPAQVKARLPQHDTGAPTVINTAKKQPFAHLFTAMAPGTASTGFTIKTGNACSATPFSGEGGSPCGPMAGSQGQGPRYLIHFPHNDPTSHSSLRDMTLGYEQGLVQEWG